MDKASRLLRKKCGWKFADGMIHLHLNLPTHAVAAITLEFKSKPRG
jgi:hypothetical protein